MSNRYSDMVVCKLYKLGRFDGDMFTQEQKVIIRTRAVVTKNYMEEINETWKTNGKLYVLDQDATDKYHEDSKRDYDIRKANKHMNSKGLAELGGALSTILSENAAKPAPEAKEQRPKEVEKEVVKETPKEVVETPAATETDGEKLARLRAEAKVLGIKSAHTMGADTLEKRIKEHSQPASTTEA